MNTLAQAALVCVLVISLTIAVPRAYAAGMEQASHDMNDMRGSQHHSLQDDDKHHVHAGHQEHTAHIAAVAAKNSDNQYIRSETHYDLGGIDLLRMDDQVVKLSDELNGDTPVILNFIFTSCTTICPVLSSTFAQFQSQLGDEAKKVKMVSISIDPQYDTPKRLREYAKRFQAGPQWKFYTGSDRQSVIAQKAFNAYRGSKMNHIPLTFLKPNAGSDWVRLEGFTTSNQLLREYRNLTDS